MPRTEGPTQARVIAGSLSSTPGAFEPGQPVVIADWHVAAGASVRIPVARTHEVLLYAYRDVVWIGDEGLALREGQLALLGPGNKVVLRGPEKSLREAGVLLLASTRRLVPPEDATPTKSEPEL
jgi:redox-sensitive bicupin YhaK (pirin superfamily)